MKPYLVIGVFEDSEYSRFADTYVCASAEDAEEFALAANQGLIVAGVVELVNGEMQVAA